MMSITKTTNNVKTYEEKALTIIENCWSNAEDKIKDQLEELYLDHFGDEDEDGSAFEGEFNSQIAFFFKLVSDQLINQGVTPKDIPLKYLTSGQTGLPVPFVNFNEVCKHAHSF